MADNTCGNRVAEILIVDDLSANVEMVSLMLKDKVRVACNYFSGMSIQGMYFYHPESFTTLGMIIDI